MLLRTSDLGSLEDHGRKTVEQGTRLSLYESSIGATFPRPIHRIINAAKAGDEIHLF